MGKCSEAQLRYSKEWRKRNREKDRLVRKQKYHANPEHFAEIRRKYYQKHKEKVKAANRKWVEEKKLKNPKPKITTEEKTLAKKQLQIKKNRKLLKLDYYRQKERTFAFHNRQTVLEKAADMCHGDEELHELMKQLLNKGIAYDRRMKWQQLRKSFEQIQRMEIAA